MGSTFLLLVSFICLLRSSSNDKPTGGAKGIGRAIVESFLAEGAIVSYCSRSTTGYEFENFKEAAQSPRAFGTAVDISDRAALQDWVKTAHEKVGRVDIVVANGTRRRGSIWVNRANRF